MKSPFADCDAIKHSEQRTVVYRNEQYEYTFVCYKCPKTGETFTTNELDAVNMIQVKNQYRCRHNIPYINEIRKMRKSYGLSAAKMSFILGWGENQFRLYENGEMPSVNNGLQLRAIQNVDVFCNYVNLSNISLQEKKTIVERAKNSLLAQEQTGKARYDIERIFGTDINAKYEGYTNKSLQKLKNVMLYFINNSNRLFQTSMNKLLFYTDFLLYRECGHGLTGLSYIAQNFGPVPLNWTNVFSAFEEISTEIINCGNGNEGYILTSDMPYDINEFSAQEMEILNQVRDQFIQLSPTKISEISHKEKAWTDNIRTHGLIDYSYAFQMTTI